MTNDDNTGRRRSSASRSSRRRHGRGRKDHANSTITRGSNDENGGNGGGKLSREQRRFLALLALPPFGISLAYTVVTTYLPYLIHQLSGPAVTGVLIGGEGIFALFVPIIVGTWSDSLSTRIGGRMPFILAGTALAVPALILMGLSSGSLVVLGIALTMFFIAYFIIYPPYYALFPDLVPGEERGRSQGAQGGFRSAGMLLALVGGGLLLALWQPLPFLVGAVAIGSVIALFFFRVRKWLGQDAEEGGQEGESGGSGEANWKEDWELIRDNRDVRVWTIANGMWEAAIGALRAFVVLYFTEGLGLSLAWSAGALALVGVAAVAAAPLSGTLADRYGHRPVLLWSLTFFGLGLLPTLFTTNHYFLIGILPVAFAAVIMITLPYSVLMGFLPQGRYHGGGAALFLVSRGVGTLVGAMLAGVLVELLRGVSFLTFDDTRGFAAIFLVASFFLLASIPLLYRMNVESKLGG